MYVNLFDRYLLNNISLATSHSDIHSRTVYRKSMDYTSLCDEAYDYASFNVKFLQKNGYVSKFVMDGYLCYTLTD